MSVVVKRAEPIKQPPVRSIVFTDSYGDRLIFQVKNSLPRLYAHGDKREVSIHRADARELAAALVEWADSVEG